MGKSVYGKLPKTPVIYMLKFEDGSTYIGRSTNLRKRLQAYMSSAKMGKTNQNVFEKIREFGIPQIEILEEFDANPLSFDTQKMHDREMELIEQFEPDLNIKLY